MGSPEDLKTLVKSAAKKYKRGTNPSEDVLGAAVFARELLQEGASFRRLSDCDGKEYWVWETDSKMSRPILADQLMAKSRVRGAWKKLNKSANPLKQEYALDPNAANRVVYSIIAAVSAAFDLWMPKSRKTPGTYFEVLIGSLLGPVLPGCQRTGHVIIPNQAENVATDIVFSSGEPHTTRPGLVVPVKITTRERIVQPYAHQGILDSVFGEGVYRSVLVCMSEMQRDDKNNANAICVPGTIRLFQTHLAKLSGLYYLDPPARYLREDVASLVQVRTVGQLLCGDLRSLAPQQSI